MNPDRQVQPGDPDSVLGAQLRRIRTNRGWSQEQLAQELDELGWSGATVAKIEGGTRKLSAVELIVLGEHGIMHLDQPGATPQTSVKGFDILHAQRQSGRRIKAFDAERRAASTLGVTTRSVSDAAAELWGQDFLAERELRLIGRREAGKPSGRGASGRVSREMTAELRMQITKKKGSKGR